NQVPARRPRPAGNRAVPRLRPRRQHQRDRAGPPPRSRPDPGMTTRETAMASSLADSILVISLEAAVPLWMAEFARLGPDQRRQSAAEAAEVIASQGHTLQYGSVRQFGHGARQMDRHLAGARRDRKCGEVGCWCNHSGQPAYSAGEVFNFLARGLACAAYQS